MIPKKGTKKKGKKGATVDCTLDNQNATVEDADVGDVKRKPSSLKRSSQPVRKLVTAKSKIVEEKPIDAAIERELETFINFVTTQGVAGLRSQYAEFKNYIPPNYRFDAFTANPTRNRYADVVCLDDTRVRLAVENPGETDYIHANWVKADFTDRLYIACQGPLDETIPEFWRMCYQHNVFCIVMLCKLMEEGKQKCCQYWPEKEGAFATHGKIFVNNKKVEKEDRFIMTTIELLPEGCSDSKIVKMIQFASWPDRGVPLSGRTVLRLIRQINLVDSLATGAIVIHCSAGIGRTGTMILIDWIIQQLFKGISADIDKLFKLLRNQRASAIQTEGQYLFVFSSILDYIKARVPSKSNAACDKFQADYKALNLAH